MNDDNNLFLDKFKKESAKMEGISLSSPAPKFWINTGNYIINKIISGSYNKGIAQGRLAAIAGPSGSGKSFLAGNIIKSALLNNIGVLAIDSENALDDSFMEAIGANIHGDTPYLYRGITTISQATNVISKFTKMYREHGQDHPYLIVLDSLDMLQTDSENEKYERGEIGGDQGQHAKQIKSMLRRFVNDIKEINVAMLCTKQVYQEQDPQKAFQNPWRITESSKFAFSQIALVTKLLLKNEDTKNFEGIKLKVRGEKTRFCKPFQQSTIEVPYDEGMDPYTGVLEAAVAVGIVEQNKAWYTFNGKKFQRSNFESMREEVLQELIKNDDKDLKAEITEDEDLSEILSAKESEVIRKTRGFEEKEQE